MKNISYIVSALLLFAVAAFAQAQPLSNDTAHKLIVLSGTDAQAKDAAASAGMMFSQSPLGQAQSDKIKAFQSTVMDYNNLVRGASQSLKASLTEEQGIKLVKWYEGNFGNRVARAEEAGSTPEAMQSAMQNAQTLLSDPERVEMADKLIDLMGTIEESINMQKALTSAIFAGMSSMQSPDQPVDLASIEAMINAQVEAARPQVEQQMRLILLNMYKDFSLQELKEYYGVLNRPEMKAFNQAGAKGMVEVMTKALAELVAEDVQTL